jgi:hypothetical protein
MIGLIGFGTVIEVGSAVELLSKNDRYLTMYILWIPAHSGLRLTFLLIDDSVVVSHSGAWAKTGVFLASRVRRCPPVSAEDAAAFSVGLTAWGILNVVPLKKGDTVVHALAEGPLLATVTSMCKDLGVNVTNNAETKNARLAILDTPSGKIAKCLAPKGAVIACSGSTAGAAAGASAALSVTDAIFNDTSLHGFDLGAFIATTDDKKLSAGRLMHTIYHYF